MLIDVHAHTSKHSMRDLHVKNADIPNLEQLARQHRVDKIVLMATYFPFKGTGLHNQELLSRIEGNPRFLAFVSMDLSQDVEAGIAEMGRFLTHPQVVGIKLYPGYQDFDPAGPDACRVYSLAAKHNLPVALHGGELHHCCSAQARSQKPLRCGYDSCPIDRLTELSRPNSFEKAIQMYPEVNFLVSHMANPHFAELHALMQHYPNVYTDISGQFLSGSQEDTPAYRCELVEEINHILELDKGPGRLLFGTDFPIQSYDDSLDLLKQLKLDPEELEMVRWKNATKLLNL